MTALWQILNHKKLPASLFPTLIYHLCKAWLTLIFAQNSLIQRLAEMHYIYRGNQKHDILNKLKADAKNKNLHWHIIALARYNETFIKYSTAHSYNKWIEQIEKPRLILEGNRNDRALALAIEPLLFIFLIIDSYQENHLCRCIESILKQSYIHWHLCITFSRSTPNHIIFILEKYAATDNRIELIKHKGCNLTATKEIVCSHIKGEFITILPQSALLARSALFCIVKKIAASPQAALLYSDEDRIDAEDKRFNPAFKPGWNPDLFFSQNYISYLCIIKTELIQHIKDNILRDWNRHKHGFLLRCIDQLAADQIIHIPEVLYHEQSNAAPPLHLSQQRHNSDTDIEELASYFKEKESKVTIKPGMLPETYRVQWHIPTPPPLVSLIIPTKNCHKILKQCIESIIKKTTYTNYEIIILDNQSSCPKTISYLRSISSNPHTTIYSWNHEFNYSAINNFGATLANGSILGLMNNDIEIINDDWLEEMVSHAYRDDIGCVGAKLYYPDETIQHAGIILGIGGIADHGHKHFSRNEHGYCSRLKLVQNLSAVTGACLLVRKSVFEEVKGLNENLAIAFNDVDFCLKVQEAGYRNLWTPYAELYHHESVSRGANDTHKKRARLRREADYMRKRWGSALHTDPAYNPNLTLFHTDFSPK